MSIPLAPETLRRKKMTILFCGMALYFLTSMSKVLIPAAIYSDLQALGLDGKRIAATGAAFMYAYAASQLLAGVFADRYGGVRILLIGGSLFAVGSVGFPLTGNYVLMLLCRLMTGFGAGTVFLGVAKLLNDLFSEKFSLMLGVALLLGYFGPTVGTVPMKLLVGKVGWRCAMFLPGALAMAAMAVIVARMRGTIKPTVGGQTFAPLWLMMKNRAMWMMCIGISIVFGAYYGISSQFGAKSLSDLCGMTSTPAAAVIMVLTIIVAANNMGVNLFIKLCGNRRKPVIFLGQSAALIGAVCFFFAARNGSCPLLIAAFVLIAIPAGFFPLYGTVGKELNPPEHTALSVAIVNFWCFVAIALFQNVNGWILQHFSKPGAETYSQEAYVGLAVFLGIAAAFGVMLTFFYPETGGKTVRQ